MGLGFIGVIKQSSLQYPMAHIKSKEFTGRVNCCGLVSVDEVVPEMMSFSRVDNYRC